MVVFGITMLIIGTLMHSIGQMKYCKKLIKEWFDEGLFDGIDGRLEEIKEKSDEWHVKVKMCIRYHIKIIE